VSHRPLLILVLAALTALSGCASRNSLREVPFAQPPQDADRYEAPYAADYPDAEVPPKEGEEGADAAAPGEDPLRSSTPGSGVFINEDVAKRAPPGAGETGEVTFNFEGESLHAVVKAILGDFLQQNYVIAPGVQGTVTFSTAKPLRGDQALSILEMLLRWNNATLVWQDGRYTILPVAQALPGNLTPRSGPAANARGYEVRAVPLQYISALEMEKLIKPYAKPEGIVNVDPARNMLVLAGTRAELENYMQTIQVFDVDWLEGMSVGVFPLQQAEAAKTVTELEKIFGTGSNTPMAGMFRFMPLEGINAVMVITPQPKYLDAIEEWMMRLDLGGGEAGQRLYVYDVKNVKASDLASTLSDIFGGGSGGSGASRPANPSGDNLMPGLEPVQIRTVGSSGDVSPSAGVEKQSDVSNQNTTARRDSRNGDAPSGTDGGPVVDSAGGIALGASDEVRVSAVEESNALLVRATSGQWESIRRVIERLDTIPLQVHIEAQIVGVALTDELRYGVSWFFENGIAGTVGGDDEGEGGTPISGLLPLARAQNGWGDHSGSVTPGGVGWTFIGPDAVAIVSALDKVSDTVVLSAPSLVVLNNKTANINVGTQIPITSSFTNNGTTGGVNNGTQSYVQFRQTGITLNVTPRVNPGGLVFMEVSQEESAPVGDATPENPNVPVSNRSIETEVAVQSGQTLVLGGLIKTEDIKSNSGLPGLSRLPLIGGLFGTKGSSLSRTELLVLITPRVIRDAAESRRLTEEYSRRFRGMEPLRVRVDK
jgi:general secretion pathway protein D